MFRPPQGLDTQSSTLGARRHYSLVGTFSLNWTLQSVNPEWSVVTDQPNYHLHIILFRHVGVCDEMRDER